MKTKIGNHLWIFLLLLACMLSSAYGKEKEPTTAILIHHLHRVITDETNKVAPQVLFAFVAKYQRRAHDAGVDDLDRQTQYLLLALYTSGRGVEHPACIKLMKSPPKSLDEYYAEMQKLPEDVWNAGPPLWGAQ